MKTGKEIMKKIKQKEEQEKNERFHEALNILDEKSEEMFEKMQTKRYLCKPEVEIILPFIGEVDEFLRDKGLNVWIHPESNYGYLRINEQ